MSIAEGFLKECILSVKEFAQICTSFVLPAAAYTGWNHFHLHRNLKLSLDPTHAWMF